MSGIDLRALASQQSHEEAKTHHANSVSARRWLWKGSTRYSPQRKDNAPLLTLRDTAFLANLGATICGACYHACQYAPPHEFGGNVPQT